MAETPNQHHNQAYHRNRSQDHTSDPFSDSHRRLRRALHLRMIHRRNLLILHSLPLYRHLRLLVLCLFCISRFLLLYILLHSIQFCFRFQRRTAKRTSCCIIW